VNAREIVSELELLPHPEGGYFKETYRSSGVIPKESLEEFNGPRSFGTGIYYLLEQGQFSALHRIKSDEIWHHYHGGVLEIIELSPEAGIKKTLLGSDPKKGQVFQHVVPAGVWFGARPVQGEFVLVGCTVFLIPASGLNSMISLTLKWQRGRTLWNPSPNMRV
jgi:hypothetical protein